MSNQNLKNNIIDIIQEHASESVKSLKPDFCMVAGFNVLEANKDEDIENLFCVNNFKDSRQFMVIIAALTDMYFDIVKRHVSGPEEYKIHLENFLKQLIEIGGGDAKIIYISEKDKSIH